MLIYQKLASIQAEIHAPKSEYNEFGKYRYRTAEAILEAVKPFLKEHGCMLCCSDELIHEGDRYYIKATATITCIEDGSSHSVTAYAREELDKKGMDQSQVTGGSSSYARKYALNGLLCIDNTPDSDTTNQRTKDEKPEKKADDKRASAEKKLKAASSERKPLPERGSEEWANWVAAINTGWKSKTGKTAVQVFAVTYAADDATMQDVIGLLEEDAFNARLDQNNPAQVSA